MDIPVSVGDKCTFIFFSEINLKLEVDETLGFGSEKKHSSADGFIS